MIIYRYMNTLQTVKWREIRNNCNSHVAMWNCSIIVYFIIYIHRFSLPRCKIAVSISRIISNIRSESSYVPVYIILYTDDINIYIIYNTIIPYTTRFVKSHAVIEMLLQYKRESIGWHFSLQVMHGSTLNYF